MPNIENIESHQYQNGHEPTKLFGASKRRRKFQAIMDMPSKQGNSTFERELWEIAKQSAYNGDKDWAMFFLSRTAPPVSKKDELDEEYIVKQIDYVLQKTIESKLILVIEERLKEVMKQLPQLQNQNLTSIEFKEEEVKDKQT